MKLLPDENIDLKIKKLIYAICWMVLAIGFVGILFFARPVVINILDVLSPFIIGGILAYVFDPIVSYLQYKLLLGRIMGVVVFIILLILIILLFAGVLLPVIYYQAADVVTNIKDQVPKMLDSISEQYNKSIASGGNISKIQLELKKLKVNLATTIKSALPSIQTALQKSIAAAGDIAKGFLTGVKFAIGTLLLIIISTIICFYILLDTRKVRGLIQVLTPDSKESRVFDIIKKINTSLGGFLRGQLIVCAIVGTLSSIGLFFIGLKQYALLIGFIAGMANAIPYLGPIMGATPAIIWAIFTSHYGTFEQRLIGIGTIVLLFGAIQTIDGIFISPRVIGKTSELHPLFVILAIIVGSSFGFIGLLLSVPAACILKVLWKEFIWDRLVEKERLEKLQANKKSK